MNLIAKLNNYKFSIIRKNIKLAIDSLLSFLPQKIRGVVKKSLYFILSLYILKINIEFFSRFVQSDLLLIALKIIDIFFNVIFHLPVAYIGNKLNIGVPLSIVVYVMALSLILFVSRKDKQVLYALCLGCLVLVISNK